MKNPNLLIALSVIFILILGVKYGYYDDLRQEEHPAVNEIAGKPDDMFRNATHYYRDYHQRLTSINYINKAIRTMKIIEKDMDSLSNKNIDKAIADLELLIKEFENNEVEDSRMQRAFAEALNSLAYAQLQVSEAYSKQGRDYEAYQAIQYALKHLHTAKYFSEEAQVKAEQHILDMINDLMKEENLDEASTRQRIHAAIMKLDSLLSKDKTKTQEEAVAE